MISESIKAEIDEQLIKRLSGLTGYKWSQQPEIAKYLEEHGIRNGDLLDEYLLESRFEYVAQESQKDGKRFWISGQGYAIKACKGGYTADKIEPRQSSKFEDDIILCKIASQLKLDDLKSKWFLSVDVQEYIERHNSMNASDYSIDEFLMKSLSRFLFGNESKWLPLRAIGALAIFRRQSYMLTQIESMIKTSLSVQKYSIKGGGLAAFLGKSDSIGSDELIIPDDFIGPSLKEGAEYQKQTLGFYETWNPLWEYQEILRSLALDKIFQLVLLGHKAEVSIGGVVKDVKIKLTKKGDQFIIFQLESIEGDQQKVIFWPKNYEKYKDQLLDGNVIALKGISEVEDESVATVFGHEVLLLNDLIDG